MSQIEISGFAFWLSECYLIGTDKSCFQQQIDFDLSVSQKFKFTTTNVKSRGRFLSYELILTFLNICSFRL